MKDPLFSAASLIFECAHALYPMIGLGFRLPRKKERIGSKVGFQIRPRCGAKLWYWGFLNHLDQFGGAEIQISSVQRSKSHLLIEINSSHVELTWTSETKGAGDMVKSESSGEGSKALKAWFLIFLTLGSIKQRNTLSSGNSLCPKERKKESPSRRWGGGDRES